MSNDLIKLGGNLQSPRDSKATDWPNVGASGPEGQESGRNQLVMQTENQRGPRHTQDSGDNTPSVWGKVDGFTISKSKSQGTSLSFKGSIDCESGQMSPNAVAQTY